MYEYNNPIINYFHTDKNGNHISILRENEQHQVMKDGKIILDELPDEKREVIITDYIKIPIEQKIQKNNEYKVDYKNGIVYVNPTLFGKTINITRYYGLGVYYFPASRVWLEIDENNNVLTTLMDIENKIKAINIQKSNIEHYIKQIENISASLKEGELKERTEYIKNALIHVDESYATLKKAENDLIKARDKIQRIANVVAKEYAEIKKNEEYIKEINKDVSNNTLEIQDSKQAIDKISREITNQLNCLKEERTTLFSSIQDANKEMVKLENNINNQIEDFSTIINNKSKFIDEEIARFDNKITTQRFEHEDILSQQNDSYNKIRKEIQDIIKKIENKQNELNDFLENIDTSERELREALEGFDLEKYITETQLKEILKGFNKVVVTSDEKEINNNEIGLIID